MYRTKTANYLDDSDIEEIDFAQSKPKSKCKKKNKTRSKNKRGKRNNASKRKKKGNWQTNASYFEYNGEIWPQKFNVPVYSSSKEWKPDLFINCNKKSKTFVVPYSKATLPSDSNPDARYVNYDTFKRFLIICLATQMVDSSYWQKFPHHIQTCDKNISFAHNHNHIHFKIVCPTIKNGIVTEALWKQDETQRLIQGIDGSKASYSIEIIPNQASITSCNDKNCLFEECLINPNSRQSARARLGVVNKQQEDETRKELEKRVQVYIFFSVFCNSHCLFEFLRALPVRTYEFLFVNGEYARIKIFSKKKCTRL